MFSIVEKIIQLDASFSDAQGNQYPAGSALAASSPERAAVGLVDDWVLTYIPLAHLERTNDGSPE